MLLLDFFTSATQKLSTNDRSLNITRVVGVGYYVVWLTAVRSRRNLNDISLYRYRPRRHHSQCLQTVWLRRYWLCQEGWVSGQVLCLFKGYKEKKKSWHGSAVKNSRGIISPTSGSKGFWWTRQTSSRQMRSVFAFFARDRGVVTRFRVLDKGSCHCSGDFIVIFINLGLVT